MQKEAQARIKINKLLVIVVEAKREAHSFYAQYIPAYIHDYVGNIKEFERV